MTLSLVATIVARCHALAGRAWARVPGGPMVQAAPMVERLHGGTTSNALNVLKVMQFIAGERQQPTIRDISEALQIPKATLYRLVESLRHDGWLNESGPPRRFALSLRAIGLGLAALEGHRVRDIALPNAIGLASESRHSVFFALYEDGEVFYLDAVDVVGDRIMPVPFYRRHPALVSAAGRIILAHFSDETLDDVIERHLPRMSARVRLKSSEQVRSEIRACRSLGYATPDLDIPENPLTVACAVLDETEEPVASFGLFNLTRGHLPEVPALAATIQRWTRATSVALGYRPERSIR